MRTLACTVRFYDWLDELAFLGHALSLGLERLRHDATTIRATLPSSTQRDNQVLERLRAGFPHSEAVKRGFSPDQLVDGDADQHRQSLNQLLLFEVCAAFERWATDISSVVLLPSVVIKPLRKRFNCKTSEAALEKALQFPDSADVVVAALAKVAPKGTPPGLPPLRQSFRKAIIRAKGGDAARFQTTVRFRTLLRGHLTVYRAHKELRNCLVHSSKHVGDRFATARAAHDGVDAAGIGLKELPKLGPVNAGDAATVSLRGVFGLMQVVRRAAEIIDGYAN